MHDHVQLCQDPQTEFALIRESLGVSRVHTILQGETAVKTFDEVGAGITRKALSRIKHKMVRSKPRSVQASQAVVCKRSVDVARPEHLGAVIAARPRTKDVIRDVTTAGLVVGRPRLTRLDVRVETAIAAFLDTSMTARGSPLPSQSRPGNDEAWEHEVRGKNGPSITGPTVADVE